MECKQLYNIDTNTLIILYPKGMILEVRDSFIHAYPMEKERFTVLYLLGVSYPHVVTYTEIIDILSSVDIEIETKKLKLLVKDLKKELRGYNVRNLIVSIKKTGYAISNKWVEPNSVHERKDNKLINYVRRMCGIVAMVNKQDTKG